jgi:uncharacterized membrane protein
MASPIEARRHACWAFLAGLGALAGTAALPYNHFRTPGAGSDVVLYDTYATRFLDGSIPYHGFFFEYPPLALAAFVASKLPGLNYAISFRALMWLLMAVSLAAALATLARLQVQPLRIWSAAALIGCSPALVGPILFERFDAWPAALLSVSLFFFTARRWTSGAVFLALSVATKLYPIVVVPIAAGRARVAAGSRGTTRAAAAGVGAAAIVMLPFAAIGPGGLAYSYYVQFKRPLQLESLGASLLLGLDRLGLYETTVHSGLAKELAGTTAGVVAVLSSALQLAAVLAGIWWFWRGPRDATSMLTAAAAVVASFVAFGKVLSPQYVIWLLPLAPLVARRVWFPAMALTATAAGLTNVYFPWHYRGIREVTSWVWVLAARNLVLVALALVLLDRLRRDAGRGALGVIEADTR